LWSAFLFSIVLGAPTHAKSPNPFRDVNAYVTGYNTTPGQTDDTPCIAASGANICGRTDAVACPRRIGFGTILQIRGMLYICEDRLAKKYDSRFDISCDKNTDCPPQVTGWTKIRVFALRATPQIPAEQPARDADPALAIDLTPPPDIVEALSTALIASND
jgi:hypothetical protein